MTCIFCEEIKPEEKLFSTDNFFGVFDIEPEQVGHFLVISQRHVLNMSELNSAEIAEFFPLIQKCVHLLEDNFPVAGTTVVINHGSVMDEGVHFHAHLIPRYLEDQFWQGRKVSQQVLNKGHLRELLERSLSKN